MPVSNLRRAPGLYSAIVKSIFFAIVCVLLPKSAVAQKAVPSPSATPAISGDTVIDPVKRENIRHQWRAILKDSGVLAANPQATPAGARSAAASGTQAKSVFLRFSKSLPAIAESMALGKVPQSLLEDLTISESEISLQQKFGGKLAGYFAVDVKDRAKVQKLRDLGFVQDFSVPPVLKLHDTNDTYFPKQIGFETPSNYSDTIPMAYTDSNNQEAFLQVAIHPTADVDINSAQMWAQRSDTGPNVVAVIDSGLDTTLHEFQGNLWVNAAEIPGNGIDDDGNGVVDDMNGAAFFFGTPNSGDISPRMPHGTEVSGVLAARRNNSSGIAGVAGTTKLISVAACDSLGCQPVDLVNALVYLIDLRARWMDTDPNNGGADVRVINLSVGGPGNCNDPNSTFFSAFKTLLSEANRAGIVITISAGNEALDTDATPYFPAGCDVPNIISVGASDNQGRSACFADWIEEVLHQSRCSIPNQGTNYGRNSVDLAAPGHIVLTSLPMSRSSWAGVSFRDADGAPYAYVSGTSFSSPIVAGVSALMLASNPALTPELVRTILIDTVRNQPDLTGKFVAPGIVDGSQAVTVASTAVNGWKNPTNRFDTDNNGVVNGADALAVYNYLYDHGNGNPNVKFPVGDTEIPPPFSDVDDSRFVEMPDVNAVVTELERIGKSTTLTSSTAAGSLFSINIGAHNAAVTLPAGATYDRELGTVTWIPTAQQSGQNLFKFITPTNVLIRNVTVTVAAGFPTIVSHPASVSAPAGSSASFSCSANGTPAPSYQWQKEGVNIAGATSSSVNVPATTQNQASHFRCVASNSVGSATSNSVTLTVTGLLAFQTHPSSVSVNEGATVTFSPVVSGNAPITYQWQKDNTNIAGATSLNYSFSATKAVSGSQYRVVATNAGGSLTSNPATVTVTSAPQITLHPLSTTIAAGTFASLTCAATGSPAPTFQWQRNGVNISGATSSFYTAFSTGNNGAAFRCVATNSVGSANSNDAILTVTGLLTFTTQPASQAVSEGANATFSAAVTGRNPITYQWQKNNVNISGATALTFSLTAQRADNGAKYQLIATNLDGTATSAAATLTVNYAPQITTQPASATVAAGAVASFSCAASGSPAPSYQWQKNGGNISGATSPGYTVTAVAADNGAKFRCIASNAAGNVPSNDATLTVTSAPQITTQPVSTSVSVGGTASFSCAASGNPAPTYQWQKGGINIAGASASSYSVTAASTNNGAAFRCVATSALGSATSNEAILTVTGLPTFTTQPASKTVNERASVTFTAVVTGAPTIKYQWQKNGANITGATASSYTFTPVRADNGAQFKLVATNSGGSATSATATLTVQYAPEITTQPAKTKVAPGARVTFTCAASGSPAPTYQWKKDSSNISGATAASYSFTAAAADNGSKFSCTATNAAGSDTSKAAKLTVK